MLRHNTTQAVCAATLALAACTTVAQAAPQATAPATQQAAPAVTAIAQGGTVHGSVIAGTLGKPGTTPLPGVAITATNTLTGRKYTTATDVDGAYTMQIPRNGRYVLRAELAGFAAATLEVVINGADTQSTAKPSDFGLELASRAAAAEAAATSTATSANLRRGLQNLGLTSGLSGDTENASASSGANTGAAMPSLSGLGDTAESSDNSIAVSGQNGSTNALANFSEDEIRQRVEDGVAQARASGMIPAGVDPTNAIVGVLGGMMGGGGRGPGGGGGRSGRGGGGGGFGSGAFRNFDPTQIHGGLNYTGDYSALDSAPWSATLLPQRNTTYARNTFGFTLAGSPYIPGVVKPNPKQFVFLNANLTRNTSPIVYNEVVPTALERGDIDPINNPNGDAILSGLTQTKNGSATVTPVYDPTTGMQFANNVIPRARISPQALYILQHYYPEPNVPATGAQAYNYNATTTSGQNTANISMRYVRSLGANASGPFGFGGGGGRGSGGGGRRSNANNNAPPVLRQSINANFSYTHSASDQREPILALGGASFTEGYNVGVGYTVGYGRLSNNATLTWNRSDAETRNYFTDTQVNPATASAITVPSQGAVGERPNFYNGLPTSSITNFLSINNINPSLSVGQTISFSDFVSWRHLKHNYRFGMDVRRVHQDSLGGTNPLGTFQFSGYNTQSARDQACSTGAATATDCTSGQTPSGAGFADFLLGLPQQSTIQAGLNKVYLRENVLDGYAQDDFRVRNGLTLNYGIRWEYFGPFYEKNDRLANITGVVSGATSIGCVTPNGITAQTGVGTLNCTAADTRSLIHPDRSMYSPRFAVAWRPSSKSSWLKDTVVRAGYGINYNTGQFATFAKLLAYEPPFALTQNNLLTTNPLQPTGCTNTNLTLAAGFNCSNRLYQNSFGVDPNYRLGLVQVYNADIQRTLPWGVVLNLGYNGSKGSDLDVTRAPNHTVSGVTTPNAVAFRYEDSIAASYFNALTVNARKRLQSGISLQATYQYAHSIDNASSFGGGSNTSSIQNDARLDLERSNSSFDVRHRLTGNWVYELPVGPNRRFLNKGGFMAAALDGFNISGNFTFASGSYYTPSYQTTAAEIAAGGNYTLRPNRDFSQPLTGGGSLRNWFNRNAFTPPPAKQYGTASRYSIEGPGQLLVSAALSRTVKLGDTRSFEGRIQASNVFNTVQYNSIDTILSSATFGQVTGAAQMRQIQFTGRYRF